MTITIHRGTHQIGGCVTEYESEGWRLFVDYGEELQGGPKSGTLKVEGLTHGDLTKSALLITHYHGDHIGCIPQLPEELPIYMGRVGREIQRVASGYMASSSPRHKALLERLDSIHIFEAGKAFQWGVFNVMPITIDHSAFDAYAFKITAGGMSVYHTGDFRTHGFRSRKFEKLMRVYVRHVDAVVCEGTRVNQADKESLSEQDLQKQFEMSFREHHGNIVYLASTNIDRLFALYHAARRAGRRFLIDDYQKDVMEAVGKYDPLWSKSKSYHLTEGHGLITLSPQNGRFWMNKKLQGMLEQDGYVFIARANDHFDRFIERLPGEKHKYLSMWKGYVDESCEAYNPTLAKSLGKDYEYLHTSGHCDMKSLRALFRLLQPKVIIPIHTDNPKAFADLFSDEFTVTVLNDGDIFNICSRSSRTSMGESQRK